LYLLDTHVAIWALVEPEKLTGKLRTLIESETLLSLSVVSLWEFSIKFAKGKLTLKRGLTPADFPAALEKTGIDIVQPEISTWAGFFNLPVGEHKDPFDRMLIWQAIREKYILVTRDGSFAAYAKAGLRIFR
jgi:PIN domain nuclease of toxin-antitoxin system